MNRGTPLKLLAGVALGLIACAAPPPPQAAASRPVVVRTATAERRDLEDTLLLTGTLKPRAQVQVVAEIAARLLRLVKDEGAPVAKGEVLAVLDDTDYRLAHERAQAALAVAEANKAHAEVEKDRADHLLNSGGITKRNHLTAELNLRVAEAALGQARAEEAIAAEQRARAEVRAPFAGRIARRLADPGTVLSVGSPIFTLVDDAVMELRAPAPSEYFGKARIGAPVTVTVDALPGVTAEGRVVRLPPLVDERSRSFEVVVEVRGRPELVGGLFARGRISAGRIEGAVVVPPNALVRDGTRPDEATAFGVVSGKAERRPVKLGVETPDAVQVTQGLIAGEPVILDPPPTLASGSVVEAHQEPGGLSEGK